jgi:ABC-type Fe3+-hydroxamate transport system substrate-binding protein
MATHSDQLGRTVALSAAPLRIVSLVPSITELLYVLGLDREVVGITKFCVHPEEWRGQKSTVGGTKQFHHDKIAALRPTLILANKEENREEDIRALEKHYPVWVSDVRNPAQCLDMIRGIGEITHTSAKAHTLADTLAYLMDTLPLRPPQRALYLIWRKPWMAAGTNTYIHHTMALAGYTNCLTPEAGRYPELTDQDLQRLRPEVLLLSSEPYPFDQRHVHELRALLPHSRILLTDGELYSWHGPKLMELLGVLRGR